MVLVENPATPTDMHSILAAAFLALVPLTSFAGESQEEEHKLNLDSTLTFGTLTAAGLKFLNPQIRELWSDFPNAAVPSSISLKVDRTLIGLTFGGAAIHFPKESVLSTEFLKEELQDPGNHYPPAPPIQEGSEVFRLRISTGGLPLEDVTKLYQAVATAFKLDTEKVDAWFTHRMWEVSSGQIRSTKEGPAQQVAVFLGTNGKNGDSMLYSLVLDVTWGAPETESTNDGPRPRPRTVPSPVRR